MSDRELLEAAARAAGMVVWRGKGHQSDMLFTDAPAHESGLMTGIAWRPLEDSGQALELAVTLGLDVSPKDGEHADYTVVRQRFGVEAVELYRGGDPMAATRRAIVRAAAEIGRGMA